MKLVRQYKYLSSNVINYINEIVHDLTDFDENRFFKWLVDKNIAYKTNPSNYVKACFQAELENGTFSKVDIEFIPAIQPMLNFMRDKGIKINIDDTAFISVVNEYMLNEAQMTQVEVATLNRQIIDWILTRENPSSSDYVRGIKKANALKDKNMNWELIDSKAQFLIDEKDRLLKELAADDDYD